MDPKHVLGAFLTLSMFGMLANMIKKEHFDSAQVSMPVTKIQFNTMKIRKQTLISFHELNDKEPWKEDGLELRRCWTRPARRAKQSNGFVTLSLTYGPEYHVSQIADAVVVARYLGATLVLPDIRESNLQGETRNFQEIYDVEKFVKSLHGVVKVVKDMPRGLTLGNFVVVRVPNRVTEDHIAEQIAPLYQEKHNLRLASFFPSINMKKTGDKNDVDSITCLGMFGTLDLQPEVQQVVDSMVERLRILSRQSEEKFIAVDLRVDVLEKKGCQGTSGTRRKCYNAREVGEFLKNVGFDKDTTIYLTQTGWHSSLDTLKDIFPKTYTKDDIMPGEKKKKFLYTEASEFEKAIDFYICSQSDVFVPAISGLFYANVAGKRIASGKTHILVPDEVSGSASVTDFISPYVTKKNHMAYSCFCPRIKEPVSEISEPEIFSEPLGG